ncbi:MAG: lipoate--protein ligase family protein, partial [Cyanobacteria bacterium J06598_3]
MADGTWRLIPSFEGTGLEQMAIDSWLLDQHVKGLQPPSLRFYTWRSPTLSLGYHQRQFPEAWKTLQWQGQPVDLVRRPTGGRAVLHQGDLTYALITSGLKGSRREVYQQLCQFLIEGWQTLGISLAFGAARRGYIHNPNCFGTATAADLVMDDGYKLIGSAQVYRNGCVLQHGSIRLRPDTALFQLIFGEQVSLPNLPKALRAVENQHKITAALTKAAEVQFLSTFQSQPLTPAEKAAAMTT